MRKEELVVEEDEDLKMVELDDDDEDIWRSRLNIEVDFCSILIVMPRDKNFDLTSLLVEVDVCGCPELVPG